MNEPEKKDETALLLAVRREQNRQLKQTNDTRVVRLIVGWFILIFVFYILMVLLVDFLRAYGLP